MRGALVLLTIVSLLVASGILLHSGSGRELAGASEGCQVLRVDGVKASAADRTNLPENTLDQNMKTRWSAYGSGSWINFDLGMIQDICFIEIDWYKGNHRVYDFSIEISQDGQFYIEVFDGRSSGREALFERVDFADAEGRYIRITVNGNTNNNWASITEIVISGIQGNYSPKPVEEFVPSSIPTGDTTAPNLSVDSPMNQQVFAAGTTSVIVSGTASDDVGVTAVKWSINGGPLSSVSGTTSWSFTATGLSNGESYTAMIQATDEAGNTGSVTTSFSIKSTANPSPSLGRGLLEDPYGVSILGSAKQDGRNWHMNIDNLGALVPGDKNRINPAGDIRFEFEAKSATINQEDGIRFVRLERLDPQTDTAMKGSNKVRIHIFSHERGDADPDNIKYNWRTGASESGYMIYPDDIKAAEYTLIARIWVLDANDAVSFNLGGAGHHIGGGTGTGLGDNAHASTYESHFEYGGAVNRKQFSTEFDHGWYERYNMQAVNEYSNIDKKWMGFKVLTIPSVDKSARLVQLYFNENPIDFKTGEPKNEGWRLYTTWIQTHYRGQPAPHVWGGAMDTVRLDWVLQADIAHISVVEISGLPKI